MSDVARILQVVTALAFAGLGLIVTLEWLRHRDRQRGYLALALGSLGLVSLLGQVQLLIGNQARFPITVVTLVGFQLSGWGLLLFRGTFVPLPRWARIAAPVGLFVPAAVAVFVGLPPQGVTPNAIQAVATYAIIIGWSVCIAEPSIRFLLAARQRPRVQQRRLQALAAGYLGIVLVLVVAVGASIIGHAANAAVQVGIQIVVLFCVPLLYVAFAPPRWIRRAWREPEELAFREATQELLLFAPDRATLAGRGLEWAIRIIGAEAGFVLDGNGELLATTGLEPGRVARLRASLHDGDTVFAARQGAGETGIVQPLPLDSGTGYAVVIGGPYTPLFGEEEVGWLKQYAGSLTAALDRDRVVERMVALEEVKSRFLRVASHELRGPLALVKGYVSMIQDGSLGSDQLGSVWPVIISRLNQMSSMLDEMLLTARLEDERLELKPERFDMRDAVIEVINSMQPLAAGTHDLQAELPAQEVPIVADRQRVETIVTNLLDNAIKYSPDGGPITCRLDVDGAARLSVSDRGLGIAPEDMPTLFTRFGRIVRNETTTIAGTGLGLYLSRELARLQEGELTAESEQGKGSTFTLRLPLAPRV